MSQPSDNNDSDDDGHNQSFMAHAAAMAAGPTTMTNSLTLSLAASPQQEKLLLLQNDEFLTYATQLLNMTTENLANMLSNNASNSSSHVNGTEELAKSSNEAKGEPLGLLITLTVCYALIFIAGILGNLITCIVISRNNFMHTATNFYLFNLAVSDLILLVSGIPQELCDLWYPDQYPFTDVVCVMGSVLCEMAANTTVLTITAFTVERYIAICHPFRAHSMSKLSRAIKFIFAIWLAAFLLALPQAMQFSVVFEHGGYSCTMKNDFFIRHMFAVSGFIFFCGPMTAICVLYVLIGVKLKRSRLLQLPRRAYDANRGLNAQSRVIRMLVAVAVAFFLCWAPFHAQRLMAVYSLSLISIGINEDAFNDYFRILDYTSGVLYFLSPCINPLLYNIMSHKFRDAFKKTLKRQFGLDEGCPQQGHYRHNYSAVLRPIGSSLRLPARMNNNALEPYESYRLVHFRCREDNHQLSLQDSLRTTNTTTTTITSSSPCAIGCAGLGMGGRQRGRSYTTVPHRQLQTQISQLSALDDANSLLEASDTHARRHNCTPNAKRALLATNNGALLVAIQQSIPLDAAAGPEAAQTNTYMGNSQGKGKRLKLSRIKSHRHGADELKASVVVASNGSVSTEGRGCLEVANTKQEVLMAGGKLGWRKKRQRQHKKSTLQNSKSPSHSDEVCSSREGGETL